MATMLMTQKNRAARHGKHLQGPGGRYCLCCDEAPRHTARARRTIKRSERNAWKRDTTN